MVPGWKMEAYERLRIEIVRSAVTDLQKAIRKSDRLGCMCDDQIRLEAWFLTKWGQLLCENRGEYIVQQCRETYKTKARKPGKQHIPDDVQQKIAKEYRNGTRYKAILQKYKIPSTTLYNILRRWEN